MGFAPQEGESALPPTQGGGSASLGETCSTAQPVKPQAGVISKSTVGAREDVAATAGCGDGPEVVLRFSEGATRFPLRIEADFSGSYAVGRGCPLEGLQTRLCGSFSDGSTQLLSLDVTADTYLILSNAPGSSGTVELWLGEAAP